MILYCFLRSFSVNRILKLILITNYSKICAIVTLIWVEEDQELYDQSLLIFTMPAQYEAYRGTLAKVHYNR